MASELRFDGKVAIVTGAGQGLGREYALELGRRGARVLVNDFSVAKDGASFLPVRLADQVAEEIRRHGGEAIANYNSVVDGDLIVGEAIKAWGKVDIVINNAGILRDTSFTKMGEDEWDAVLDCHLKGTFMVTRAAWNYMRQQKYGRVVNTTSIAGIYGNFGQANYSAAKLGIHGFTNTIAREGASKGINSNTVAPMGNTRMVRGVLAADIAKSMGVKWVVPLVMFLCHESCEHNGGLFENGSGLVMALRWQRSKGAGFRIPFTAEDVAAKFEEATDFESGGTEYPTSGDDTIMKMFENFEKNNPHLKGNPTSSKGLKTTALFELISNYFKKGEGSPAVKKCQAVYNIDITMKKKGPVVKSWGLDLKNGGGSVSNTPFAKVDATFKMTDEDFYKVCMRELNPQIAFLQGKMKIKGNMKKATLFTPDLFPKPTPENMALYSGAKL